LEKALQMINNDEFSDAKTLSKLVKTALAQDKLSGLSAMIGVIAESVNAPIAILWQVAPDPVKDTLFILSEWFQEPQHIPTYFHTLPRTTAKTTWEAIETGKVCTRKKVDSHDGEFFENFGIKSLLSIPLVTDSIEYNNYALNIYWTTSNIISEENSAEQINKLEFISKILLDLYFSLVDKVSYSLIEKINQSLSKLNNDEVNFKSVASEICEFISETLQAHQVSLYLSDEPDFSEPVFKLQAATWRDEDSREELKPDNNTLTTWVLKEKKPIIIFNLTTYNEYRIQYENIYPYLSWNGTLRKNIQEDIRNTLKIPKNKNLPPLSFIAIPVKYGNKLFGVIRFCVAKKSPYYFPEQKKNLLVSVANQISQAWNNFLSRKKIEEENNSLDIFVKQLANLNDFVLKKVTSNEKLPKDTFIKILQDDVFNSALTSIHESINNVKISSIRLVNKKEKYLYFVKVYGDRNTPNDKFYFDETDAYGEPVKVGVWVYKNKKTYVIDDDNDKYYKALQRFKTESMIVSPIKIVDEVIGIIDVHTKINNLAPHIRAIIELIGLQLGLYSYLFDTIVKLKDAVETLEIEKKQQTQTYEDFTHQLKSPIQQLKARAYSWVEDYKDLDHVPKQLLYLRGLSSKALRVTQTIKLFAELSTKGKSIKPRTSQLTESTLRKILIESAIDQENTIDPTLNIKFHVNKDSLACLNIAKVNVDIDLLRQAISNLLDNAAKYSYSDTIVSIYCDVISKTKFHITVRNEGLPLLETEKCKERNWRGKDAASVTGEGSGIGLWIVDCIMKAHEGNLLVISTIKSITEVKLIFPATILY